MPERYHVLYCGERLDNITDAQLREGLARLFKADDSALDRLLSGRPQILRKDCERETAERYRDSMAKVGALARIQRVDVEPVAAASEAGLSLAPPGTPVLRPEERRGIPDASVTAPELEIDAPGARLAAPAPPPPAPPNTSHLSLAPVTEED